MVLLAQVDQDITIVYLATIPHDISNVNPGHMRNAFSHSAAAEKCTQRGELVLCITV